ncbi:MAG: HD domain-containing protein, partial [Proteiniphilum sp.]
MSDNPSVERREFLRLYRRLYSFLRQRWEQEKVLRLREMVSHTLQPTDAVDEEALNNLVLEMRTALITVDEIGLRQPAVCAVLLYRAAIAEQYPLDDIRQLFGDEVEVILRGLKKINRFSDKRTAVESENYMKLLLSMAEDIRVVFVLIARQLQLMRDAKGADR